MGTATPSNCKKLSNPIFRKNNEIHYFHALEIIFFNFYKIKSLILWTTDSRQKANVTRTNSDPLIPYRRNFILTI